MWWFLFIFLLAQNSFAEELKLNINGNKRTKDKIVRHIFEKCLENEIDHSDENLAQCLKNATIFSETKVIKTSDGYDIEVEDRWTLIPIPRIEADTAGDKRIGLGVVDSNFLGRQLVLYAEYIQGKYRKEAKLFYLDPSLFLSSYLLRFKIDLDDDNLIQIVGNEWTNRFNEKNKGFDFGVGYNFGHYVVTPIFESFNRTYSEFEGYPYPENYKKYLIGLNFFYDNRDFKLSYSEGFKYILGLRYNFSRNDGLEKANAVNGIVDWNKSFFSDHVLISTLLLGYTSAEEVKDSFRLGRTRGFRGTLSKSIFAKYYYGVAFNYQIPIQKYKVGDWVGGAFLDLNRYKNTDFGMTSFASYGLGTWFFLKKIAMPGLGLEVGIQNQTQEVFYNFSVGIPM